MFTGTLKQICTSIDGKKFGAKNNNFLPRSWLKRMHVDRQQVEKGGRESRLNWFPYFPKQQPASSVAVLTGFQESGAPLQTKLLTKQIPSCQLIKTKVKAKEEEEEIRDELVGRRRRRHRTLTDKGEESISILLLLLFLLLRLVVASSSHSVQLQLGVCRGKMCAPAALMVVAQFALLLFYSLPSRHP